MIGYIRSTTRLVTRNFRLQNLGDLAFLAATLVLFLDLAWAVLADAWFGLALGAVLWLAAAVILAEYHAALDYERPGFGKAKPCLTDAGLARTEYWAALEEFVDHQPQEENRIFDE
jgi:hypothetical protein